MKDNTMKKLLLLTTATILMLSAPTRAQDTPAPAAQPADTAAVPPALPVPAPSPAPASAPVTFYLEVNQQDLQVISAGINELPKKIADPLILKLNAQLNPQVQAKIDAAKSAEEKPAAKKRPGKRD